MNHLPIIVFGIIILLFVWRGYQKGFVVSLVRYSAYLIAYAISIIFTIPLSNFIFKHSSLDGLIVYFIAAMVIFFTAVLLINFLFRKLLKVLSKDELEGEWSGKLSKISGAALGLAAGCFIGLLMVYILNLSQKVNSFKTIDAPVTAQNVAPADEEMTINNNVHSYTLRASAAQEDQKVEEIKPSISVDSFINSASKTLVSKTITAAAGLASNNPTTTQLTKTLSKDPDVILDGIKKLSDDQDVNYILTDPEVQNLLKRGDTQALMKNNEFHKLMENKNIKTLFSNKDGTSEEEMAREMVMVWQRVELFKNNPRVIAILSDPEFIRQINAENTMQLMMNPKMKELIEIVSGK